MSFLEILMKAWKIVTAQYPNAQFYEADGHPEGGSGTNPDDVQEWRFVCNNPPGSKENVMDIPFRRQNAKRPLPI